MSSIKRALTGEVLVFDLREARGDAPASLAQGGRSAQTLLKSGPLRVTKVVMAAGAEIAEHQTDGSITVQPLEGRILFTASGKVYDLGPGQLLAAGPGIRHSVATKDGATFLLTVAKTESTGTPESRSTD